MLEKPSKIQTALICGCLIGVVASIPGLNLINCCCCASAWLGGVLAMYLYKRQFTEGMPPLESSDALILGLMSGVIGAFVGTVLGQIILLLFGSVEARLMKSLVDRLSEQGSLPPEMADKFNEQLDEMISGSAPMSRFFSGLFITLVLYPIFTCLGALLGFAMFRPKKPPEASVTH